MVNKYDTEIMQHLNDYEVYKKLGDTIPDFYFQALNESFMCDFIC